MNQRKKVILSAGGTGGHLFPAQAVADKLQGKCEILFVGGGLGKSRYFDQSKYSFAEISTATFSLKSPWRGLFPIFRGIFQSLRILRKFKPDVVVGFGSFFTFPLLVAAKLYRVPILLHEQNSLPGKVNRIFSRHAVTTAITFPETAKLLKGKSLRVAFPLRWVASRLDKKMALSYFGLEEGVKTILVFGGSQGGAGLNRLFLDVVPSLPKEIQVIHFTGNAETKEKASAVYRECGVRSCVKEFEAKMDLAWNLADMAFTRAGASTISELMEWEVPALLIPFPFATDQHQTKNGKHFTDVVRGGVMFIEEKTNPPELKEAIETLLKTQKIRKGLIQEYKRANICPELETLILGKYDG